MTIVSISFLITLIIMTARHVESQRNCRCYATGNTQPQLLNWITGNQPYHCQPTGTCTANPNTGCFRLFVDNKVMLFCGQDELSAAIQTGQSRPKSDQISALFSKGYIESRLGNNGNCTSANLKQQGVCFCDDADYCNSKASIFVALNYILILMVSVIVLMQ